MAVLTRNNAPKKTTTTPDYYEKPMTKSISFTDLDTDLSNDTTPTTTTTKPNRKPTPEKATMANTNAKTDYLAIAEANLNKAKTARIAQIANINKGSLFTITGRAYLAEALDKQSSPMNPKHRASFKPKDDGSMNDGLQIQLKIRNVCAKAFDASPKDPKKILLATAAGLETDKKAYVTFFKDVMGQVGFIAGMDVHRLHGRMDVDAVREGLAEMGDSADDITRPIDPDDIPGADVPELSRVAVQETYEGGDTPQPIADNLNDLYMSVWGLQCWLSKAFNKFSHEDAAYWGVDGLLPFATQGIPQPDGTKMYVGIQSFDDYLAYNKAEWQRKKQTVPDIKDTLAEMDEAA